MRFQVVIFAAMVGMAAGSAMAQGVYHNGYMRSDGIYVAPHYQSAPDHSYNNNWSTNPNVNPYTGQMGTRQPTFNDQPPAYYQHNRW
jgi:hypothetical protein